VMPLSPTSDSNSASGVAASSCERLERS
jgi:hypothetical protein